MKIEKTYDIIIMTEGSDPVFNVARAIGGYKVASALRNEGYSVFVLHNFTHFIQKGNIKDILDKLIGSNTLWVGFSSTLFMKKTKDVYTKRHTRDEKKRNTLWRWPTVDKDIKEMTDYIRYTKGVKTVYGGMMNHLRAREVKDCIDYYVVGMGEHPALHISDHIRNGTKLRNNIAYGKDPYILDYDQKGALFDFRNAQINYVPEDFWNPEDAMGIEFGRGCIFKCKFCSYPLIGKKKSDNSFLRNKECIKHELQQNYDLYGTTRYVIIDDTFNEQTSKLKTIAEAIEELDLPTLEFSAYIRVDLLARWPEQIDLLKRINVRAWFLGIESLNYESAKSIGKGCRKETVFDTIKKSRKLFGESLSIYGSFIAGLPYDSKETMDEWTKEVFDNNNMFDAFSFSPLELGIDSELSKNPEKFGYTVYKENGKSNKWYNKYWNSDEVIEYVKHLQHDWRDTVKVSSFFLMFYQCLGYTFDELRNMSFTELFSDPRNKRKGREYLEKTYYSKVEKFLGIKTTTPNIKFMKDIPISKILKDNLRKEFNGKTLIPADNINALYTVDDMSDCLLAKSISRRLEILLCCDIEAKYYMQEADSNLPPCTKTNTAIQIVLDGNSPITWEEDVDVNFECALLNLENMHSQLTTSKSQTYLQLMINKNYQEVLQLIKDCEQNILESEKRIT